VYAVTWSGFDFFPNVSVVNEANPSLSDPADASVLPGVHYVYNVADSTEPAYAAVVAVAGFTDSPGGTRSALCSGSDASLLLSNGFLPLPARTSPGGNSGVTCRLQVPSA
jgi:hypothetical protein